MFLKSATWQITETMPQQALNKPSGIRHWPAIGLPFRDKDGTAHQWSIIYNGQNSSNITVVIFWCVTAA